MTTKNLENRFTYHPPNTDQKKFDHEYVRGQFLKLAVLLDNVVPDGDEKDEMLHRIEEAMFWANAGIART